jgi:SAM-dependent methyltransferase
MGIIIEVEEVIIAPHDPALRGCFIDRPVTGHRADGSRIDVIGWALGAGSAVDRIEALSAGRLIGAYGVGHERPDVAAAFPDDSRAGSSGFRTSLALLGDVHDELSVRAVLEDGTRAPIGTIRLRRAWLEAPDPGDAALVSVVIPCFDQAEYLSDAIESVLAQTYPHFEVLVVDDGSRDNTAEIAARFPGVRYLRQENLGLASARNTGLRYSNGRFVVFLDADDRLKPTALETGLRELAAQPDCAFVSGQCELTAADGSLLHAAHARVVERDHYRALLQSNYILSHATVMYRRAALDMVGGFDESLAACEDYDLNLRLTRLLPAHCHAGVVAEYRRHGENMHLDARRMLRSASRALEKQWSHAKVDPLSRQAYRIGKQFWIETFGAKIADEARARRMSDGLDWRFFADLWAVARRKPRLVRRFVRKPTADSAAREHGAPAVGRVRMGDLRRLTPLSDDFGYSRGTPIDRVYVERFLARHAQDIRGRVLEVGDATYTHVYGGKRVENSEVIHLTADNPNARYVADLANAPQLPTDAFDCFILTQTLQLVFDVPAALETVHRVLKPGGVALATFPGMSRIEPEESWNWAFTVASARRLFGGAFPEGSCHVEAHGNVLAASAFLYGIAAEELDETELLHADPSFPLLITVRAVKAVPDAGLVIAP